MWVPLFVKAPHQRQGRVDDRNWEQVDLLPTITSIIHVKVPWKMDGFDQTGAPARQRREKWWYGIPGHREVRDGPSNLAAVLRGETDTVVRASEGVRGLYRFGAFADLVYKPPRAVGPVSGSPAAAALDDWDRYKRIDPASGEVPALVSGKLTSPAPPSTSTVLVAVNGRIGGESRLYPGRPGDPASGEVPALVSGKLTSPAPPSTSTVLVAVNGRIGGESRLYPGRPGDPASSFSVIAPDFFFKAGPGIPQLQVFLVHRDGGQATLQPVTLDQDQ
jgi:hypothetical protein